MPSSVSRLSFKSFRDDLDEQDEPGVEDEGGEENEEEVEMEKSLELTLRPSRGQPAGCPNIETTLIEQILLASGVKPEVIKSSCLTTHSSGFPCCQALCRNGYRCQREGKYYVPLAVLEPYMNDEQCIRVVGLLKTLPVETNEEGIYLCDLHSKYLMVLETHPGLWVKLQNQWPGFIKSTRELVCRTGVAAGVAGVSKLVIQPYLMGAYPDLTQTLLTAGINTALNWTINKLLI